MENDIVQYKSEDNLFSIIPKNLEGRVESLKTNFPKKQSRTKLSRTVAYIASGAIMVAGLYPFIPFDFISAWFAFATVPITVIGSITLAAFTSDDIYSFAENGKIGSYYAKRSKKEKEQDTLTLLNQDLDEEDILYSYGIKHHMPLHKIRRPKKNKASLLREELFYSPYRDLWIYHTHSVTRRGIEQKVYHYPGVLNIVERSLDNLPE